MPGWMRGQGVGWITAEYGMLPGSTSTRKGRDATRGRLDGRTVEIQRLIGRSLRAVVDRRPRRAHGLGRLRRDPGRRRHAPRRHHRRLRGAAPRARAARRRPASSSELPLTDTVAAVSVGIVDGTPVLDLPYVEDSRAEVDMNVVMTGDGRFVEVQGTAEGAPFGREDLDGLLALAEQGIREIRALQLRACAQP